MEPAAEHHATARERPGHQRRRQPRPTKPASHGSPQDPHPSLRQIERRLPCQSQAHSWRGCRTRHIGDLFDRSRRSRSSGGTHRSLVQPRGLGSPCSLELPAKVCRHPSSGARPRVGGHRPAPWHSVAPRRVAEGESSQKMAARMCTSSPRTPSNAVQNRRRREGSTEHLGDEGAAVERWHGPGLCPVEQTDIGSQSTERIAPCVGQREPLRSKVVEPQAAGFPPESEG